MKCFHLFNLMIKNKSREHDYEHGTILSERIDKSIKIYHEQFSKQKDFNGKIYFKFM